MGVRSKSDLTKGAIKNRQVHTYPTTENITITTHLSGLELADRGDFFWYLKFDPPARPSDLFCPVQAQTRSDQGRWSSREARSPSNQRAGLDL